MIVTNLFYIRNNKGNESFKVNIWFMNLLLNDVGVPSSVELEGDGIFFCCFLCLNKWNYEMSMPAGL